MAPDLMMLKRGSVSRLGIVCFERFNPVSISMALFGEINFASIQHCDAHLKNLDWFYNKSTKITAITLR